MLLQDSDTGHTYTLVIQGNMVFNIYLFNREPKMFAVTGQWYFGSVACKILPACQVYQTLEDFKILLYYYRNPLFWAIFGLWL